MGGGRGGGGGRDGGATHRGVVGARLDNRDGDSGIASGDRAERDRDALFQALGPCEGYDRAGATGSAHPLTSTPLVDETPTREAVSLMARTHWLGHFCPPGEALGYTVAAVAALAAVGFLWVMFAAVCRGSKAAAVRRVVQVKAAGDRADPRATPARRVTWGRGWVEEVGPRGV
jgi:hypothetical protein